MKLFRKISLRLRLVLLMGAVLTVACTTFLLTSNASARDTYKIQRIVAEKYDIVPEDLLTYTKLVEGMLQTQDHVFSSKNMMIAVLIILLGTGATYFMAKGALKPVAALSSEVNRISENNLSTRVAVPDSKDEVTALAEAFNKMIGKLEKAFLSQKNFSASAAHELRTPLTAMIASIEVCQLDEQPSLREYEETLDEVLQNAERLKTLVNDLLMMNADSIVSLNEAVDARELTEQIIEELSPIAGTEICFDNQIGIITLIGNQSLLYRAFFNLLHNAVKYNKPGGSVTVSGAVEDDMNVITVSDTGIGIPQEQLDKIFDSFYCVDKSHSRELGGSGLGLSIVKSIVEKHNGTIDVQSKLGVSTTFTLRLPK
jgi:signal transduction histidine kinase